MHIENKTLSRYLSDKLKLEKPSILLNPLTPRGDQHLISPYNITPEWHIMVTRIKEIITN